jgi:BolA family transcriptional regulator, general stress-responsive regulator
MMTSATGNPANDVVNKDKVTVFVPDASAAAQLEQRLRETLQPGQLEVRDESAAHAGHAGSNGSAYGTHFRVRIASPLFAGKSRVDRHRLVYDSLQVFIAQGVHAIAIETLGA